MQQNSTMNTPVPAPRTLPIIEHKKPIPTPRKLIPIVQENVEEEKENKESETNFNTFSRRVKTFSSTSKQLTEELAGRVQEKKKAVIEGTRQSVRKITRRFTTAGSEQTTTRVEIEKDTKSEADATDIFNSISFQSPIRSLEQNNIYNNVQISSPELDTQSVNSYQSSIQSLQQTNVYNNVQISSPELDTQSVNSSQSSIQSPQQTNIYNNVQISSPELDTQSVNSSQSSIQSPQQTNIYNNVQIPSPELDTQSVNSSQSSIRSPQHTNIYNNMHIFSELDNQSSNSSDDSISLPPPVHPPPALREDSIYDQPQSLISGSSNSNSSGSNPITNNHYDYECVFPSYPYNSDSDSCIDMTACTLDRNITLSRSESWNYYDPVPKNENIYNNVDSTPVLSITNSDVNSEIIENNKSHLEVRNTLYENHVIIKPPPRMKKLNRKTAQSVILQFDPLTVVNSASYSNVNDLKTLEELLQGDLYGNVSSVGTFDNWSTSNESEIEEYVNPPTPPARFDSLPEDAPNTPTVPEKTKTSWFLSEGEARPSTVSNIETKAMNWLKQVNEVLKKAPDIVKGNKPKDNTIMRPALSPKGAVQQRGMLYKVTSGPVEDLFGEFSARWCVLEQGSFICYNDNTCDNMKENFPMDTILSIQVLSDQKFKFKYENEDLYCLEINVSGKSRGGHVYGSRSISERRIWMQRLAEGLTSRFSVKIVSEYSRIGWAYLKEGVSGEWTGAWLVLSKRTLYYAVDNCSLKSIDLRKARCIVLQNNQETEFNPRTNDKGPNMLVDCHNGVLYLRMWTTRETKAWCHIVRFAAHNNGALLEQQQLTKNNIPVIVEKCINFIYAHGSMSEGIYRRAGSGATVLDILTKFRRDAWAVQLTSDKYTEHDVATALKRFFRDLPEPLLTTSNRQYLNQVSLVKIADEKIRMFRAVFDNFTPVAYKTVRRLLGHLHFITTQNKHNKMTTDNLASVWGPTLMYCDDKDDLQYGQKESAVVAQLISFYRNIFPENPEEIEQERLMLQVLERCLKSPQGAVNTKASGDLRVWVYLYNKEGQTYNIAIGPQKTAYEVCLELSSKIKLGVHELQLEELVLNDNLSRPIHHSEKVLDVVLRWGYWDEPDRKDNCLILSPISKYWEYIQEKPLPVSGELKFADNKTKTFKLYTFEFAQAKLSYYKDKTCSTKLASWNIEDILWYLGHETRRNPQSRWTITFILKKQSPNRTKAAPWFGNIVSWNNPGVRASWLAAMLKAEHPKDLTPPPQHVNLMSS